MGGGLEFEGKGKGMRDIHLTDASTSEYCRSPRPAEKTQKIERTDSATSN
jgi:hypothetical protein